MEFTEQLAAVRAKKRSIFFAVLFIVGLVLYFITDLDKLITPERVKPLADYPLTPLLIVLSMAAAWKVPAGAHPPGEETFSLFSASFSPSASPWNLKKCDIM